MKYTAIFHVKSKYSPKTVRKYLVMRGLIASVKVNKKDSLLIETVVQGLDESSVIEDLFGVIEGGELDLSIVFYWVCKRGE